MGIDNPLHILFLLLVVLLVFGAKRLPELGRSLGSGMRGFRDALSGTESQPALAPATHAAPVTASAHAAPATTASALAGQHSAGGSQPAVTAASAALPAPAPAQTQL
jgi:sec-independent protein translocase protein TatA